MLEIDWLLPGELFDLHVRPPGGSEDEWIWFAGPFEVVANGEEIVRDSPGDRIRLPDVRFETGKASFDRASEAETKRILDLVAIQLATYFSRHADVAIEVEGHTDSIGTAESNLDLSRGRAGTVRDYLLDRGVDSRRVRSAGYGETSPIANNDGDEGRARNRRVEIHFLESNRSR